jgi:predicted RNA-binding protein YlqC (UPF0109 family)
MSSPETTPEERIEELVRFIVNSLVDNPETTTIDVTSEENNIRVLVKAESDDVGKLIGRGGRTIKSIRTLARASVGTPALRVDIDVEG